MNFAVSGVDFLALKEKTQKSYPNNGPSVRKEA